MVKVLHFDHNPGLTRFPIEALKKLMKGNPEIEYEWFETNWSNFEKNRKRLEERLPLQDVLLIHPGLEGQKVVLTEWAPKYSRLRIGIVSLVSWQYGDDGSSRSVFFRLQSS